MTEIATVGLDLAKSWFQVHGADAQGRPVLRKKLPRAKVLAFFAGLPPCLVGMEACGSAHPYQPAARRGSVPLRGADRQRCCQWGRELAKLGHGRERRSRLPDPAAVRQALCQR